MMPTRYRIVASDPNAHLFEVCCTVADPDPAVRTRKAGDVVEIHAFRRDELMRFTVELAAARIDTCWLTLAETVRPEVTARRATWLGA